MSMSQKANAQVGSKSKSKLEKIKSLIIDIIDIIIIKIYFLQNQKIDNNTITAAG